MSTLSFPTDGLRVPIPHPGARVSGTVFSDGAVFLAVLRVYHDRDAVASMMREAPTREAAISAARAAWTEAFGEPDTIPIPRETVERIAGCLREARDASAMRGENETTYALDAMRDTLRAHLTGTAEAEG